MRSLSLDQPDLIHLDDEHDEPEMGQQALEVSCSSDSDPLGSLEKEKEPNHQ